MSITAFVLAAGLGERLLPITRSIPKPLLPLLGKPVLESVLEKVSALPLIKIGINLHYKRTVIEDWINQSMYAKNLTLFPEDPILGTGGALKNAQGFLKNGPFLVHNSDIISGIDLIGLIKSHMSSGNIATLAVHNHPELNRLILDKSGFLKGIKHPHPSPPPSMGRRVEKNAQSIIKKTEYANISPSSSGRKSGGGGTRTIKSFAFTGVAIYLPDFLQFLPQGNSSVVDAWFNALSAGYRIGTYDVTGCYWTDIGTPSAYIRAVTHALVTNGESIHMQLSVKGCDGATLDGYVVMEKDTTINKGVFIRNCIALPGAIIGKISSDETSPEHFHTIRRMIRDETAQRRDYENCIVGPDYIIELSESDFSVADDHDTFLIGTGGSDRSYYRVRDNGISRVLLRSTEDDPDFQRHMQLTEFFRSHAVPVPALAAKQPDNKSALFEDLGDLSLYSWLKCPRPEKQVEEMYKRVLDILIAIHSISGSQVQDCAFLRDRIFDYEHLRWETGYFLEQCVKKSQGIRITYPSALDKELHALASTVSAFSKTIVHRDFQSQNIMITKGRFPRPIDYQGARIGPPAYDVASILWDPYFRLHDNSRERLLEYYIHQGIPRPYSSKKRARADSLTRSAGTGEGQSLFPYKGLAEITEDEFRNTLLPCRLQRHMQALGAYAYLSLSKGKNYFLKYVPEGLRLLEEETSTAKNQYPVLHDLVRRLQHMHRQHR